MVKIENIYLDEQRNPLVPFQNFFITIGHIEELLQQRAEAGHRFDNRQSPVGKFFKGKQLSLNGH